MDNSIFSQLNWLAVLCGGLGYFILGAIWYSPVLFAKKWMALLNINPTAEDARKGFAAIMLTSLLLMMVTAVGLGLLQAKLQLEGGWLSGLKLGTITGLFFGATAISISYVYEKRPFGLHLINGGYTLIGNIIAAIIICSWPA